MRPLRVVVVDDSALNRRLLSEMLESMEGISVVGRAADGEEALRVLGSVDPDLVTLDLEMPKMDGFSFLRFVMARKPIPVIVVSSHSAKQNVFRALELGALDFIPKPGAASGERIREIAEELAAKVDMVRLLRPRLMKKGLHGTVSSKLKALKTDDSRPLPAEDSPERLIVIASSTGGPSALVDMFAWFDSDSPAAAIVVQHMPPKFTRTFAERLDRLGGLRVSEAADGDPIRAGRAFVCPGGRTLEITNLHAGYHSARVAPPNPEDRYVPSADRVFSSAAATFGARTIGVVMTGMGDDGAAGAAEIVAAGGKILVQSPEDAVVDGMPRAAMRATDVEYVGALANLSERVAKLAKG